MPRKTVTTPENEREEDRQHIAIEGKWNAR